MIEYDSRSWLGVMFTLRGSIVPRLLSRVLTCATSGALAAYLFVQYGFKIPTIAHQLLGVALGLLLVFRTNASYDRYWEGRRLFGGIINRTRNLMRQASGYLEGDDAEAQRARQELRRLVLVLFALIRQYLRKERELDALGDLLRPEERAALEPVKVRPCLAAHWISAALFSNLKAGRLSEERLKLLDENVTQFVDLWGGAERIMKTPIPFAYAQHIKGFLALFCITAPFALVESMRWYTPLAAAIIAYGMFGIEEIGVEIEDPFGYDPNDLPLDAMGETIANDTRDILAQRELKAKAA
jgi:ion channel-forming bestrophin family protein